MDNVFLACKPGTAVPTFEAAAPTGPIRSRPWSPIGVIKGGMTYGDKVMLRDVT